MAEYGMQIYRSDGRLFASPEYTPYVLVSVVDVERPATGNNQQDVQTNIPNGRGAMMFCRSVNRDGGVRAILVDGGGGFKVIRIFANRTSSDQGNGNVVFRFYLFSNFVAFVPAYGIAFYRNNQMVYCGNCLPLQIKSFTKPASDPNPQVMKACYSAMADIASNPLPGGGGATITVISGWMGVPRYGAIPYPYIDYNGEVVVTSNVSNTCLYIETDVYDSYYRQSLGL